MRKFLIMVILALSLTCKSNAAPSFQLLSSPTQVGRYEVFQSTFQLNTVATNYSWPYDANPPASISPGIGVTVDAIFTNSNTNTVLTVPCFFYQNYDRELISGDGSRYTDEAIMPNDTPYWMVRFAPPELGAWSFKLKATDASGTTIYPSGSGLAFNCVSSSSKGFVKVSPTDPRYFELSDGTPIVSPGINIRPGSTYDSDNILQKFGQNGVRLARWGISFRDSQNPFSGGDYSTNGGPQWDFSLALSSDGGCKSGDRYSAKLTAGKSTYQNIYLEAGVSYIYTGYVKASGVTASGAGTGIVPYIGSAQGTPLTGSTGWQSFSIAFTPYANSLYQVGVINNGSTGTGYFDDVYLSGKKPGDTAWSPNYLSKGDFDFQNYIDPRESWKIDHIFQVAKDNGVYLKTVISDKQDTCLGSINPDGSTVSRSDDNFYASSTHPSRWYQKTWWRYLIARWGAYSSAHSWELCNEGDPFNGNHYDAANALAGYMKSNDPYRHLVTTSFWHSIPMAFWKDSLCDYIDAHEYSGPATPITRSHGPRYMAWEDPDTSALDSMIPPYIKSSGRIELDASEKHTGSRSLKITAHDMTSGGVGSTNSGCEYHVGVTPGQSYTFKFWAKGSNLHNPSDNDWQKPRLLITWSAAYHENDWVAENSVQTALGTFGWTQYTGTFTVPAGAYTANVMCDTIRGASGDGDGLCWFDDIEIINNLTGQNLMVDGSFEGARIDYDSALAMKRFGVLLNSYGKPIGKPTMMGETGIRGLNIYGSTYKGLAYSEENQQIADDVDGVYLRKTIWAHAGPDMPYAVLLWKDCIEANNLWHYFKAYDNFMAGILVSNGKFHDVEATTSNPAMRAWGQKDIDDSCAYLWIDNTAFTWKSAVDKNILSPISGTVTIQGFRSGTYIVEWWNTSTGMISSTEKVQSVNGSLVLNVSNLLSDIACKVYNGVGSAPFNVSLTPNSGTIIIDKKTSLTSLYSDPAGYSNIKSCYLMMNSGTTTTGAGYLFYDALANKLYLRKTNEDVLLGGYAPGSANIIDNGAVILYCADTVIQNNGNDMTINWSIALKPYFARNTCTASMQVTNKSGYKDLMEQMGTFNTRLIRPDLLIKNETESAYSGTDIINTDGTDQTKTQNGLPNQKIVYVFRVKNAGENNDSFKITGPAGGSGWGIKYYDLSTGADVTTFVTGAGYPSGILVPGLTKGISVSVKPDATLSLGATNTLLITAASDTDNTKIDVVKAATNFTGIYKIDMLIKSGPETSYSGASTYSTDGTNQTKMQNVCAGQKVTYGFRARNGGNAIDSFRITGPAGGSGWSVKYYDFTTSADVTSQVTGAGWVSSILAPGIMGGVFVNIKPDATVPLGSSITLTVTGTSMSDNTKIDVVKAVTTCVASYKPDLMIKLGTEATYSGIDIINTDGTNQTKTQNAAINQKVTCSFRVKNAGYLSDSFKITGPDGGGGWTVKYIDLATGVDVTSQVTGTGWLSGTLAPGTDRGVYAKLMPDATVTSGSSKTLTITAASISAPTKIDVVKAITTVP